MAQFYGRNSGYLIKGDLKNYGIAVGLVFLVLVVFAIVLKFSTVAVPLVGIFLIYLLLQVIEPIILHFRRKSDKFYRGFGGESDVKNVLKELPDSFSVFQGLRIGENKGDIDFVVVSPSGIFILEVKSHKGEVGFNGFELTLNGRSFRDKNFLRQVHGETWALKNYIKQQIGLDVYINSALVFSSPYASMHFGYNPISNVYVIQKDFLPGLFKHAPFPEHPANQEKLKQALLKTVGT